MSSGSVRLAGPCTVPSPQVSAPESVVAKTPDSSSSLLRRPKSSLPAPTQCSPTPTQYRIASRSHAREGAGGRGGQPGVMVTPRLWTHRAELVPNQFLKPLQDHGQVTSRVVCRPLRCTRGRRAVPSPGSQAPE